MPAKSKSMFRKMFVLEKEGKISDATRHEFTDNVNYKDLPEHVSGARKPPPRKRHK
jgi:hypothetical protein